jgi:Rps23 Pro-64 3,4-dihydroxylase Tpa1-like proline 4-hydroxylase
MSEFVYEMNPEVEGTMLFFPSKMMHQVHPFYNCDEDRISISGNILLNTKELL